MSARKVYVSQCKDWCCEDKRFSDRWYNVHYGQPGEYESLTSFDEAWRFAESYVRVFGTAA